MSTAQQAFIADGRPVSVREVAEYVVALRRAGLPRAWAYAVRRMGRFDYRYLLRHSDGDRGWLIPSVPVGGVLPNGTMWQAICTGTHRVMPPVACQKTQGYADTRGGALALLAQHAIAMGDAPADFSQA